MAIVEGAENVGVMVPMSGLGTGETTVGLLGAKIDPLRAAFGIDGRYCTEVRLLEIERRILLLEAAAIAGDTGTAGT